MDPNEKDRLAQLGTDRRLAEAVGNLDLLAAELTRVAGDENSTEEAVMLAASNYRAGVQRRNIAYDRSCGIPEEDAGRPAATITHTIDEDRLKEQVEQLVDARLETHPGAPATKAPAAGDAGNGNSVTGKTAPADGSKTPPAETPPSAGAGNPAGTAGEASPKPGGKPTSNGGSSKQGASS